MGATSMSESHRLVAVLDTDIGTDVDDVLALTLLANSPGDGMAGSRGPGVPDERETASGDLPWRAGHAGDGTPGLHGIPVAEPIDAGSWLCGAARAQAGHGPVSAVGPMTNIARAIERDSGF